MWHNLFRGQEGELAFPFQKLVNLEYNAYETGKFNLQRGKNSDTFLSFIIFKHFFNKNQTTGNDNWGPDSS